jgi:hypothetical protein
MSLIKELVELSERDDAHVPQEFTVDLAHSRAYAQGLKHGKEGGKPIDTSNMLIPGHVKAYKAGYKAGSGKEVTETIDETLEETLEEEYVDKSTKEARWKLIERIAKKCGVDFDDEDAEAVKKALTKVYEAGIKDGRSEVLPAHQR